MSSHDVSAPEQDQPNKRIRLSEPIAKEEPGTGTNGSQVPPTRVTSATHPHHLPTNAASSQNSPAPLQHGVHRSANDNSVPSPAPGRVKLEDIAGAQQQQQPTSRPPSSQQAMYNGKPIPPALQKIPVNHTSAGPSTPSPATSNGATRPNPMLASHTSRYVYPAAATPMMSRTPSIGNGTATPGGNSTSQFAQSTPQRIPHPLSSSLAQGGQGRFIPSSTGLRTPITPGTAFSATGSGTPGMTGRSVMNPQPASGRSFATSTMPSSGMGGMRSDTASRPATPGVGVMPHQPPALVQIARPRTAEDARTIRETEQLLKGFIEMDQKATTQNYVSDEPFRDSRDVVDRLLPFHIWQMHDEDLDVREKSRDRKVAERQQIMQMAAKKIELECRVRALRVKGDENLRKLGYIQIHQASWPDFRDAQARAQGIIRAAQLENERVVHEYRRRNADMLRINEERRAAEIASKRTITEQARTMPTQYFPTEAKPNMPPVNMARVNAPQTQTASSSPHYVPPAHTSKPVEIRVPLTMLAQLTNLNIIRNPSAEGNVAQTLSPPPATILRTAEDMSHILISVNLTAVNAPQLAFLAELVKQQGSSKGTSTPNRIGSSSATTAMPQRPMHIPGVNSQQTPRLPPTSTSTPNSGATPNFRPS